MSTTIEPPIRGLQVDLVDFSRHACERWIERARRSITADQAPYELDRLKRIGTFELRRRTATSQSEPHMLVGQFRFPLVPAPGGRLLAVTCINDRPQRRPLPRPATR